MEGIKAGNSRQWVNGNRGPSRSQMIKGVGGKWIRTEGSMIVLRIGKDSSIIINYSRYVTNTEPFNHNSRLKRNTFEI